MFMINLICISTWLMSVLLSVFAYDVSIYIKTFCFGLFVISMMFKSGIDVLVKEIRRLVKVADIGE